MADVNYLFVHIISARVDISSESTGAEAASTCFDQAKAHCSRARSETVALNLLEEVLF
jgi:hypothetical protein